ncbi:MAG: GIY-YIG nuclease family protein [Deltaproteobacteria bacterium]|nr:GIY-YIG nuclease family protein [Deltaproteobacteria bacterium]
MFYVYILQSDSTGRFYIGHTNNLDRRLAEHNESSNKNSLTTKRFKGPWQLVHSEQFATRSEAMIREKQIKSWKSRAAINNLIERSYGKYFN